MSVTLTYGYKNPQNGDKGSSFFPDLNADIVQLNSHFHDGITSAKLTSLSITPVSATITAAGWSATSGGTYRQAVSTPPGITVDNYGLSFRIASGGSTGHQIYPSVEKINATSYYVYINDNTVDLLVLYFV